MTDRDDVPVRDPPGRTHADSSAAADGGDADAPAGTDAGRPGRTDGDSEDLTAVARELFDIPFHRANGVEILEATPERGRTRWPFDESLVGNPEVPAVHGGVVGAMVDVTGAVPFVSSAGAYTPTIDLRVDYLAHAGRADLEAEATVRRRGGSVGVSRVVVRSAGERCAVGVGVYKLSE